MEKSLVRIFTTETCPYCPGAKKMLRDMQMGRDDFVVEEVNLSTEEGNRAAIGLEIDRVPTIIVSGPRIDKQLLIDPITSKNVGAAIDVTLGKRGLKKNILQRLLG